MSAVKPVSIAFGVIARVMALALPGFAIGVWLFGGQAFLAELSPHDPVGGFTSAQRLIGLAIVAPSMMVSGWALWRLGTAFLGFGRGAIFHTETINALRSAAVWGFAAIALSILGESGLSVAMSWHNPPGERVLAISVSSHSVVHLLMAGAFWVVAWALSEGRRISDDLDAIV